MRRLLERRQTSEYEPDEQEERDEEPNERPQTWIERWDLFVEQGWTARVSLCKECVIL